MFERCLFPLYPPVPHFVDVDEIWKISVRRLLIKGEWPSLVPTHQHQLIRINTSAPNRQ